MNYKTNISYIKDQNKERVANSLKTLFYDSSLDISKIVAIRFLRQFLSQDDLLKDKFIWLSKKETNPYLKQLMEDALLSV